MQITRYNWVARRDKTQGRYRLIITLPNGDRDIIEVVAPSLAEALAESRQRNWRVRKVRVISKAQRR